MFTFGADDAGNIVSVEFLTYRFIKK